MKQLYLCTCIAMLGCGSSPPAEHAVDMAMKPVVHDMTIPDDLTQADCGQIVSCVIQSGTSNPLGALQCFTGASTTGDTQAAQLFGCLAQNCLGDGGIGGLTGGGGGLPGGGLGIFQCLSMSCSTQLSACQGLSI